jgi:lysine 6-dehydrogenase
VKALVIGAGKMGYAAATDLAQAREVEVVGVADVDGSSLEASRQNIERVLRAKDEKSFGEKLVFHCVDITDKAKAVELMSQYDVGVITLPSRRCSYKAIEAAIEARLNVVDILEEYHRRPDTEEIEGLVLPADMSLDEYGEFLHQKAVEDDVLILDGMGFAPGLSNITLGSGIRELDKAVSAVGRVGGIPSKETAVRHPLGYVITWSFSHVLREYMVKVKVIKGGEYVEVDACSDYEVFTFSEFGRDEQLECAITPGMPSFIYSRPQLNEFAEKTIRWVGHFDGIKTLKECGLLQLEPIKYGVVQVRPRDFVTSIIEPKLKPQDGDTDICVMWNTVTGIKDSRNMKVDYYMWEDADQDTGLSAMARCTAFPAAIAAVMVGKGDIKKVGIVPPEDAIEGQDYKYFLKQLERRGINIAKVVEVTG